MVALDLLTVAGVVVAIIVAAFVYSVCKRNGCDKPVC